VDPDQAVVFDRAAVHGGVVSDRAEFADPRRGTGVDVDHHEVLDVGHAPDRDLLALCAHHGVVPDRDVGADLHGSGEHRRRRDPRARADLLERIHSLAAKNARVRARSAASPRKSSAVIASAFAPSIAAASPISDPAHFVNSALWIVQCGGAAASIGWIDGTRCETLPMSVLPWRLAGSLSYGKNWRPSCSALVRNALASGSLEREAELAGGAP